MIGARENGRIRSAVADLNGINVSNIGDGVIAVTVLVEVKSAVPISGVIIGRDVVIARTAVDGCAQITSFDMN